MQTSLATAPRHASAHTNAITIQGIELPIVEYNGERVATLAMIDRAHRRPAGTARRNFNQNRPKFVEGEDFFQTTPAELREHFVRQTSEIPLNKLVPIQGRAVTLLTESGYLLLVKTLTDDLAWQVQRELVKSYFRSRAVVPAEPEAPSSGIAPHEVPMALGTVVVQNVRLRSQLLSLQQDVEQLRDTIERLARVRFPAALAASPTIEKNVPPPQSARREMFEFPFPYMQVGDSFTVPDEAMRNRAMNMAAVFAMRPSEKFICRQQEDGGYRIWRIR